MKNKEDHPSFEGAYCPLPLSQHQFIVIGHGSGGRMTHDLIKKTFQSHFNAPALKAYNDFASVTLPDEAYLKGRLSVSTDSHIVSPLFFPGGDIGKIAVCGTVNDISMSGGVPLYLTAGFILEEGLPLDTLNKIAFSMKTAAEEAGVQIIAGDTKVAEKGSVDQLFINTAGIGWIPDHVHIGGELAQPGDVIILSGCIADHGIAILSARGELGLQSNIMSDVAPLNNMIKELLLAAPDTHVLRDPSRGGLATSLNEIATQSQVGIVIEEDTIPLNDSVRSACEMLGFDPLYIANEGKLIAIVPASQSKAALTALRKNPYGIMATRIGVICADTPGRVLLHTSLGGTRLLDMLAGEILPRIC